MDSNDIKLSDFDTSDAANGGVFMPLKHPVTDKPLGTDAKPVGIMLLGSDSDAFEKRQLDRQNAMIKATMSKMTSRNGGGDADGLVTAEQQREQEIESLVACTVKWVGFADVHCPTDSKEKDVAAKQLYTRHKWVREQASAFVSNRANFFPKSATN